MGACNRRISQLCYSLSRRLKAGPSSFRNLVMSSSSAPSSLPPETYARVGRQAWIILWLAFFALILLVTGVPLGVRWYVLHATEPMDVRIEAVTGTTLVLGRKNSEPIAVLDMLSIKEGDRVRTDQTSRASLSVFETANASDSLASIQLRNNSEVQVITARRPRFRSSEEPMLVVLRVVSGRIRVTGSDANGRALQVWVKTPQGKIRVRNGSAAIVVNNEMTEITTRSGEALVQAKGRQVVLLKGRRTTVAMGAPPADPQDADKNLIKNGDFSQPLETTWKINSLVDAQDLSNVTFGTVRLVDSGGHRSVYFDREAQGEDAKLHSETSISQEINADVLDADTLVFRFDVRLISQSLPGAGIQSSEFPMMVRIDFIDMNGKPQFWTHGFYMVDPAENWPIREGEKVPPLVWYAYESPDFMTSKTFPRPAKVTSIRIYASGHNYRSQAADIELIAK